MKQPIKTKIVKKKMHKTKNRLFFAKVCYLFR